MVARLEGGNQEEDQPRTEGEAGDFIRRGDGAAGARQRGARAGQKKVVPTADIRGARTAVRVVEPQECMVLASCRFAGENEGFS